MMDPLSWVWSSTLHGDVSVSTSQLLLYTSVININILSSVIWGNDRGKTTRCMVAIVSSFGRCSSISIHSLLPHLQLETLTWEEGRHSLPRQADPRCCAQPGISIQTARLKAFHPLSCSSGANKVAHRSSHWQNAVPPCWSATTLASSGSKRNLKPLYVLRNLCTALGCLWWILFRSRPQSSGSL